jgi:hypothetical protein
MTKYIAAYMLCAVGVGGSGSPTREAVAAVLDSIGSQYSKPIIDALCARLNQKSINALMAQGFDLLAQSALFVSFRVPRIDPDPTGSAWIQRRFELCYHTLPHFPAEVVRLIGSYEPMGLIERYQLCIEPALNAQLMLVYSPNTKPGDDFEQWRFTATTSASGNASGADVKEEKQLFAQAVQVDVDHLCCALASYAQRCARKKKAQTNAELAVATSAVANNAGLPDPWQPLKPLVEVQLNAAVNDWGAKVLYVHDPEYTTATNAGTWLVVTEEDLSHPRPVTLKVRIRYQYAPYEDEPSDLAFFGNGMF